MVPQRILTAVLAVILGALTVEAADAPLLWISDRSLGAAVIAVDAASGDRTVVNLEDYPVVIQVGVGAVSPTGELFLEAVNAAQGRTVIRFDPDTGQVFGVSGFVDRTSTTPRGAGPGFEPGLRAIEIGPWGTLYALRSGAGPMSVDVATGDRAVVSQSQEPPVGEGVRLTDPLDLVVGRSGALVVADRFGGLVRIDPESGFRRFAFNFPDLVEGRHRIARLADGRIVHGFGEAGGSSLTVLDPSLRTAAELSGPERGAGPAFAGIADHVVAPDGTVYVLDLALDAVLAVDPASGDRRVVSGPGLGEGPALGLLSPAARFASFAPGSISSAPRPSGGRVAPGAAR